ncbi:molybdate ABC transporter substrate-binding protein [Helicobacter sp. MIT 21-1697]|uniref:molybdate ABC transporter substrate-binding protein n=1 Tax=Helicobacter sp. MIT 21-1697 TaxID=2993733 RepID=UPI00224A84D0|nr:molybdate ABC transporter substrate-binding protein [Helicobacter sp. MIT 21-1697]MCX2716207.1 molybdate ABC transporter substrate-binding protein [Helicobacter sp. MIT 21-1697]
MKKYFLNKVLHICVLNLIFCTGAIAEEINILAAASLKYVLEDIKNAYLKAHKNDKIHISYLSSGKAYAQIQNGFPAHLFIAADVSYPQKLYDEKLAPLPPIDYAKGKLVLFSVNTKFKANNIDILQNGTITHIAIPNPKLAPYGRAAEEFLKSQKLDKKLKNKLSTGDSIGQATNYVLTGASEIGFSALSMVIKNKTPHLTYTLIDENTYKPINQALIIPAFGKDSQLAKDFAKYITHSQSAQKIFKEYGYDKPNK